MQRSGKAIGPRLSGTVTLVLVLAGCRAGQDEACAVEDDLRRLAARGSPTWAWALATLEPGLLERLRSRPRAELQACAARLLQSDVAERRTLAPYLMVPLWEGAVSDAERQELTTQLVALLGDEARGVRAVAVDAVVKLHRDHARMPLPGAALAAIREGMQAADEEEQLAAMSTALHLGHEVATLRGTLLELLRSPSPAVRRFAGVALMRVRPLDPELQRLRLQWLEAAAGDSELPYAALASYEQSPAGGGAAIPRILQMARDPARADELRTAALRTLARLLTTPADAEAVLALLLERHSSLSPEERVGWSRQVAQLAAQLPDSPAMLRAMALLQAKWAADPNDIASAAALVRIAATHRRSQPEPAHVTLLRAEVALQASLHSDGSLPGGPSEGDQAAIEGFVALAAWPGSGVAAEVVRPLLADWANSPRSHCQDWAQELLERLPPK